MEYTPPRTVSRDSRFRDSRRQEPARFQQDNEYELANPRSYITIDSGMHHSDANPNTLQPSLHSRGSSTVSLPDSDTAQPATLTPGHRVLWSRAGQPTPSPVSSTASLLATGQVRNTATQDVQNQDGLGLPANERPGLANIFSSSQPALSNGDAKDTSTDARPRGCHALVVEWKWELFTWALGTVALASIIVLLAIFANKPLEKWKSKLSINTMVSALSQVAQSALAVPLASCVGQLKWIWLREHRQAADLERFDDASRGPEGSVRFLWNLFPWSSFLGELKRARNTQSSRDTLEAKLQNVSRLVRDHPRPCVHLIESSHLLT
jgi:hypothetical protein